MNGLNMNSFKKATRPKEDDFAGFSCNIPQLITYRINQFNGFFFETKDSSLTINNGTIVCSMETATQKYSSILEEKNIKDLSLYEEGLFIYVPKNAQIDLPLQILDVIKAEDSILINSKSVIIIGENSKLKLICCDDTVNDKSSISENTLQIFLEDNSSLEYYKMENINNSSSIFTQTNFILASNATLTTFWLSINGGNIRNSLNVSFEGEHSKAELYGLYLADRDQKVLNEVSVTHNRPNCNSAQLYKGILDDSAEAEFKGHIHVGKNAYLTEATQNNKNILLTDKARVNTQPFLEIYNDDVKCSHGATIGQLDQSAMFYMRSRGITERSAKMLLMYAFCNEVLSKASLQELKDKLQDIIKRRLHGELTSCENCVLVCNNPCESMDVDITKIN
ncbi:MAG: Fe-S cluster assembly protein SufD [Bacteroidales bacterium]|nr:Fe-S cluster assembly protein SufD [Bacteroidales bacterium]